MKGTQIVVTVNNHCMFVRFTIGCTIVSAQKILCCSTTLWQCALMNLATCQKNCHYENKKCSMANIITVWEREVAVLKALC